MENKTPLIVVAILILLGAGYFFLMPNNANQPEEPSAPIADTMQNDSMDMNEPEMEANMDTEAEMNDDMASDEQPMPEGNPSEVAQAGSYEAYSADKVSRDGSVLIFFHADWCPSCRTLDAAITASQSNIPESVTILKADYDAETELKQKYGVTTQHTIVQVDAQGNLIKKWSGGPTLDSVIEQMS